MMPASEYVEVRNGAYYVAGTRIGLDVVVGEFQAGRTAESIFEAYPSIGALEKVYGVCAFILKHPDAVRAYLKDQERRYEEVKARYPLPADMVERYERTKAERSAQPLCGSRPGESQRGRDFDGRVAFAG
jgi:uncharacterized protein (DUF433 family)